MFTRVERESESQWLRERRSRVTATDVARLAAGGAATWAAVRAEKCGSVSFRGNCFTEWGREREPHIVAMLAWEYGVAANDALLVMNGTPYAATVDALGDDLIGEAKTTGDDWAEVPPRYYDQMQWGMFVTGAEACAFGWEIREGAPGAFTPGPQHHMLVHRDDERIGVLKEIADRFLADESPVTEFEELAALLAVAQAKKVAAEEEYAAIRADIEARAQGRDISEQFSFGSLSLVTPKPSISFDTARFKKEQSDLYEEYTVSRPAGKQTLRFTPAKEGK